jgi:PAS domain S-box-containing protein
VDGYAFCRAVKSDEATKRIPFVLLTKRKSPIDIIHGLEIGADNFITKPFDDEYLLERVRRIFEHLEFRRKGYLEVEVTVHVAGHDICITADKQQIIELLFASFEELERVNARLVESQRIVERHAEELEAKVEQRTRRLRETEEKYRTLVEHLPVATYTAALDGMIGAFYISPQIEAMLGFSQAEWLADRQLWSRQLHPQDRERVLAEWAKAIAGGAAFYAEYRIHARNGEVVWLRDQAVMALDDTGQPRFMHGFLQDITSRRRAEEALRESEDRYRDLVEHSQDLVCTHDLDGRILSVNP